MIATKQLMNELLFKKAAFNFLLNIALNFLIQYFVLQEYDTLGVLEGEQNLAKIFIPFGFFLPFFISMDSIGYVYKMVAKEKVSGMFKEDFKYKRYAAKVGAINGSLILLGVLITLAVLHNLPIEHANYNKENVIAFQVILSGVFAVFFTYQPVHLLKKRNILFV